MVLCKRPAVFLSLAVLLSSLTACASSPVAKNLEDSLAADSRLENNSVILGKAKQSEQQLPQSTVQLPADFPSDIPLYTNAQLQEVTPSSNGVSTRWLSSDPSNIIESFYRNQFQTNNWQILQQPKDQQSNVFVAQRNDLQLKVSIQPKSVTNPAPNQPQTNTELLIEYGANVTVTAQATPTINTSETNNNVPQPGETQFVGPIPPA
ncbi:MAG: S-layer homology domain-containing protein, partial [Hassallia sp.]